MNSRLKLAGGAALLVLAMASAPAVYAQETTSALHGTVTANGAPVAGAAVTITHVPSGTRSTTVSGADGGFDSRNLRVGGPYTVTVTAPGYPARSFSDVYLSLSQTFDLPAEVAAAEVAAVEVVAAGRATDETGPQTVLNRDAISAVVSVNRDIRDIARRDMLVSQDLGGGRLGTNAGGISIAGSNPRFNRISVDGVAAQDNFGLAQGGMTTARGPVTLDAIEQFNVAAVPTDVENGDFIGGALNMVLRSGANSFHGSLFVNYLNEGMIGKHIGPVRTTALVSQENFGAFLSGPIIPDTLFFALSYENYKTVDTTQFGPIGAGYANSFTNLTQAQIDNVVSIFNSYASDYTIGDPGGDLLPLTQPVTDKKYSAKFDWNISDHHRASLTYRRAESTSLQRTDIGTTTAALYSHWYQQFNFDEAITAELRSDWSDNFSTFLKATYRDYRNGQNPPYGQNFADVTVCTAPTSDATLTTCAAGFSSVRFGPDQFRHANALDEQEARYQAQAEWTIGSNRLKFGVQARKADVFDVFVPQSDGLYYFDSIADFQAGRAGSLTYNNAVTGNPNDGAYDTTYWTYSGYFQDTLQITDALKATAGFRVDLYDFNDKPTLNPNFQARSGYANTSTIDGLYSVMPRVSVEWEATDSLKFSAGLGLFSGGTPDVLTGTPFYNNGYEITSVIFQRQSNGTILETTGTQPYTQAIGAAALNGLNLDPTFGYAANSQVRQLQQGTLPGATGIPPLAEVIALSPAFKMPGAWRESVSATWDVFDGWRLGANFVASQANKELTYYDSRAQPLVVNGTQLFLPDGRIRYDGLGAVPGKSSVNLGANRDIIATNLDKGSSYTASLQVSKSFEWGGDFSIGYAKNSAEDLSAGLMFGTTAGSLYASVPALNDPNRDYLGRSYSDIENRYKLELGFRKRFFGDSETRITMFGERFSGRPYGFIMSDRVSGRSPVFGVNRTAQALYVPDFAGDTNTADLNVGLVTFATQADHDLFKAYVSRFGLKNGALIEKYSNDNKEVNRLDMQISQELPSIVEGHKFRLQLDVRNLLNLIDPDWGKVSEYAENTTLTRVDCADASGAAIAVTSAACPRYRYSSVPTTVVRQNNTALSLWYLQVSLRYEF